MGTFFTITLSTQKPTPEVDRIADAAFDEISRIETMMTTYTDTSALSKVNAAAGVSPVKVPSELIALIERAIKISEMTDGKFDITFGAIGKLWRFRDTAPTLPDIDVLKANLPLLDYRAIKIDKQASTVMLEKKGMSMGLGAIAKGYAVDKASEILRSSGINDFIMYGGGDIFISGKKGTEPWRVGIQDPRDRTNYFADFPMQKNAAVVTSGDYEKFFILNGKRYHHILDPDTGYPADGTVSVTIITASAADADAFATGIFVLGPEKGMALIESTPNLEGVIVDTTLTPRVSSGLKTMIEMRPITHPEGEVIP